MHSKSNNDDMIQALTEKVDCCPNDVWSILKLADEFMQVNNLDKAEQLYDTASKLNPRLFQPFHGLARVSIKRGDDEKSCNFCKHALEIDPDSYWTRVILAESLRRLSHFDESAKHYIYAKKLKPEMIEPIRGLINIQISKGEYKEAIKLIDEERKYYKNIEWNIPKAQVQLNIAKLKSFYGLNKEAKDLLDEIPSKILEERQILEIAKILVQIGNINKARQNLMSLDPTGENCGLIAIEEAEINPQSKLRILRRVISNRCSDFYSRLILHLILQQGKSADKIQALLIYLFHIKNPKHFFKSSTFLNIYQNLIDCSNNHNSMIENIVVSYICPIHRKDDINNLTEQLSRQKWNQKEVIIIINSESISKHMIKESINEDEFTNLIIEKFINSNNVGELLNFAISRASGDYIMRFDADDIYLPNYTYQTIALMHKYKADVSTKTDFYCYFEDINALILIRRSIDFNIEHKQTLGTGSTLCAHKNVFETILFDAELKTSEDHKFYKQCRANGFNIINTPPFNHIVMRKKKKEEHTWNILNSFLMLPNSIFISNRLNEKLCMK